ncbi:unnamed protein product [Blepharisma stoltei]|uniref:Uncharacterized protein n=1 Tax=Blepharisma stoltei TaxID=1481888 RepID=A0AAU9IHK1_9CILI|nr:unnamed protein product [Blepharisma stoltei]
MHRLVDAMTCRGEKVLIHIEGHFLSSFTLSKTSLQEKSRLSFDQRIVFSLILRGDDRDCLFILGQNSEWVLLTDSFDKVLEGKLNSIPIIESIEGCEWYENSKYNLLFSTHPSTLHHFIFNLNKNIPRVKTQVYKISNDAHWTTRTSQIINIAPIRGEQNSDFAERRQFAFLIRYSDCSFVHFASLEPTNAELIVSPWVIKFLPADCYKVISVHSSVIIFSAAKAFQYKLINEQESSLICENPLSAVMTYSDNCNRILVASGTKLGWLHVKENQLKISLAAQLPINGTVEKLVNLTPLALSQQVYALCFIPYSNSIVIGINLKSLTIGQICSWTANFNWPIKSIGSIANKAYSIVGEFPSLYLKIWESGLCLKKESTFLSNASKIFRIDENNFIATSDIGLWTMCFSVKDFNISVKKLKGIIENDYTLYTGKLNNEILQITRQSLNHVNRKSTILNDIAKFCVVIGGNAVLAFYNSLHLYQNLEVVHIVPINEEVLSMTDYKGCIFVCVRKKASVLKFSVLRDSLVEAEEIPLVIKGRNAFPIFYQENSDFKIFMTEKLIVLQKNTEKIVYEVDAFRCSVIKDTGRMYEIFVEGLKSGHILQVWQKDKSVAGLTHQIKPIHGSIIRDIFYIYDNLCIFAEIANLSIGQLEEKINEQKLELSFPFKVVCADIYNFYLIANNKLEIIGKNLTKQWEVSFSESQEIICCHIYNKKLIFSSTICETFYMNVLDLMTFELEKSISFQNQIEEISSYQDILILKFKKCIKFLTKFHASAGIDISFEKHDFNEIKLKLDDDESNLLLELAIINQFQDIIKFLFINTAESWEEEAEQKEKPEFLCLTASHVHWGRYEFSSVKILDSIKTEIKISNLLVTYKKEFVLFGEQQLWKGRLERTESPAALLNKAQIDWRTHKINIQQFSNIIDTEEVVHIKSINKLAAISINSRLEIIDIDDK